MTLPDRVHLIRYGTHTEQCFFSQRTRGSYDGIGFNGNLAAWSPAGLAGFLCERDLVERLFFIDPQTHIFQHDPSALTNDENELKPSIAKLVDSFGAPVSELAGNQAAFPEDFAKDQRLFCQKVIQFQESVLHDEATKTDAWPVLQFKYGDDLTLKPRWLIAPYFLLSASTYENWLPLNVQFAELAPEVGYDSSTVAVQLVLRKDILDSDAIIEQIIESYSSLESKTILLWVSDFSEHDASERELASFVKLCEQLQKEDKSVINLYGGFLSILLTHPDVAVLSGVCHGPQYGEDRSVTPVGGGLPTARFYHRALHNRIRFADALRILQAKEWLKSEATYRDNVCGCGECMQLIEENGLPDGFLHYGKTKPVTFQRGGSTVTMNYPLREAQESATFHYIFSKKWEFDLLGEDLTKIDKRLGRASAEFGRILGMERLAYLEKWRRILSPFINSTGSG